MSRPKTEYKAVKDSDGHIWGVGRTDQAAREDACKWLANPAANDEWQVISLEIVPIEQKDVTNVETYGGDPKLWPDEEES